MPCWEALSKRRVPQAVLPPAIAARRGRTGALVGPLDGERQVAIGIDPLRRVGAARSPRRGSGSRPSTSRHGQPRSWRDGCALIVARCDHAGPEGAGRARGRKGGPHRPRLRRLRCHTVRLDRPRAVGGRPRGRARSIVVCGSGVRPRSRGSSPASARALPRPTFPRARNVGDDGMNVLCGRARDRPGSRGSIRVFLAHASRCRASRARREDQRDSATARAGQFDRPRLPIGGVLRRRRRLARRRVPERQAADAATEAEKPSRAPRRPVDVPIEPRIVHQRAERAVPAVHLLGISARFVARSTSPGRCARRRRSGGRGAGAFCSRSVKRSSATLAFSTRAST